MRKLFAIIFVVLFCLAAASVSAAPSKPGKPAKQEKPTKETILALADKYSKAAEPKLEFKDERFIDEINTKFFMSKGLESETDKVVDSLVSQFTVYLASLKKFSTLTVASCILVKKRPENPRTANLLASIIHTSAKDDEIGKLKDVVTMLEYVTILDSKSTLAKLNLANAYFDVNRDADAKAIADKIVFNDSENKAAHRVLATYWYRKNNMAMFRQELFKAAVFKGFVKKKTDKKNKKIEDEKGEMTDSTEVLEAKTQQLQDEVPFTTAEIIDEEFPAQAQQIRDKYCKLDEDAKMRMPVLPQCNTNTNEDFRRSEPIIDTWVEAFGNKYGKYAKNEAAAMGIDVNAPDPVVHAQAQAAAKKQMAKSMQQAQDMMKFMENLPSMKGADKAQIKQAMAKLQQVSKQQGVKVEDKPVNMETIPGFDSGTPWAQMNYSNYLKISHTYECYFHKYYMKDYMPKVMDIGRVYGKQVEMENKNHDEIMKKLQEEHNRPGNPHGDVDAPCRREVIRHKKRLNEIGLNYYKQWAGLYFPQYAQKMKPTLDAYWNVCMIHVRSMNNPEVMEREYRRVKGIYFFYAMQAVGNIAGGGGFKYEGPTDEEEEALEQDIRRAEQEAKQKLPEFERAIKEPGTDWSKWIEDHLVLEISGEFLSLKVTARSIEFEAWAFGPGAGIKYDAIDNVMETYTGVGPKLKVGVNVGGIGGEVEVKFDVARKNTRWDFDNGTYTESYSGKGEAKLGLGGVAVSGEIEVDTELTAKTAAKITAWDMYTAQDQAEFKN